MGVFLVGVCDGRGGIIGGGDLRLSLPEHSFPVHFKQTHYGPVSDGVAYARVKGGQAVVRSGRLGGGGAADGVSGGETDGGGRGYGQDGNGDGLNQWEDTVEK